MLLAYLVRQLNIIFHIELRMTKVSSRRVSGLLAHNQKSTRMISSAEKKTDIVWGRSSWFYWTFLNRGFFTLCHKKEPIQWKHLHWPVPKKANVGKLMASVLWNAKRIVFIDRLQKGQSLNEIYYANLVRPLRKVMKKGLWLITKINLTITSSPTSKPLGRETV